LKYKGGIMINIMLLFEKEGNEKFSPEFIGSFNEPTISYKIVPRRDKTEPNVYFKEKTVHIKESWIEEGFKVMLMAKEFTSKHNVAHTVCGLSGKPLKPFYVNKTQHGKIATFTAPEKLTTIAADIEENIIIKVHKIAITDNVISIEVEDKYEGKLVNLPDNLQHYFDCARAAVERAGTSYPTFIYYEKQ